MVEIFWLWPKKGSASLMELKNNEMDDQNRGFFSSNRMASAMLTPLRNAQLHFVWSKPNRLPCHLSSQSIEFYFSAQYARTGLNGLLFQHHPFMQIHEPGPMSLCSGNQMPINGTGSSGTMYDVTNMNGFNTSAAYRDPFSPDYSHRGPKGDTVNYQSISHPLNTVRTFHGVDMW